MGEAVKLAQTLCNFPQECLLRDRQSAFHSCFNANTLEEAFDFEFNNAKHVLSHESVQGWMILLHSCQLSATITISNLKLSDYSFDIH